MARARSSARAGRSRNATQRKGSAPSASPILKRVGIAAALLAATGLVAIIAFGDTPSEDGIPEGTRSVDVGTAVHTDVALTTEEGEVPAGGEHAGTWLNCGIYDTPVEASLAVHSLEHSAVWLTYDPDIRTEAVDALQAAVRRRSKVILSPVPGQTSPIRATAWGFQLDLDDPDDPRIRQFMNEFVNASTAPEPAGVCSGGVGRPLP